MTIKCISPARHFCSGLLNYSSFAHYGLGVPIYTQFTSPIRRYSDIVVQKQLTKVIQGYTSSWSKKETEKYADIADLINYKSKILKKATNELNLLNIRLAHQNVIIEYDAYIVSFDELNIYILIP